MNTKKSSIGTALTVAISNCSLGIVGAIFLAASGSNVFAGLAQPFTPGDIVVERLGDNTLPLTNAVGAPIFLDEMTTGGTLVQSIEIPTNGSTALVDIANSGGDVNGGMTLSANGTSIVFPGYNTNSGAPSVSSFTATNVLRGIGKLDANGNYTLPVTSSNAFTATTIRCAVSDGVTNYWATGTYPVASTPVGGVQYFGTAPHVQVYTNGVTANLRCCGIFNGNLWFDTASSTALGYGIFQFTQGMPITNAEPTKVISMISANGSFNFSVSPSGSTIYVADDGDEELTNAGIHKWTFTGGVWSHAYLLISNTPCYGLLVNWQTTPATIYATTASTNPNTVFPNTNSVIVVQDNGVTSIATTNITAGAYEDYRGLAFVPTNTAPVFQAPTITGISPAAQTNVAGNTAVITLFGDTGNPIGSNAWYQITSSGTNVVAGQTGGTLVLGNTTAGESGGYFAIITNAYGAATSSVVQLTVTALPTITGITPSGSVSADADNSITFSLSSSSGNPPASNFWYEVVGNTTTLVPGATLTSLTLNNLVVGDDGSYFAVLTNIFGSATSAVVTLTVTNDPGIQAEPANTFGLLDGVAQFSVLAFGTTPLAYQWYFTNSGGTVTPVGNGNDFGDQAVVSGSTGSTLTISNLQGTADLANVFVVVTNMYGSVTSSVASLLAVNQTSSVLAYWDFAGAVFTNIVNNPSCLSNPVPYLGVGSATAVGTCMDPGTSPFIANTTADPSGGMGEYFAGMPLPQPGLSWGVGLGALPLTNNIGTNINNGNKLSGVQFNVSTVGAKNIKFNFDARGTQTASEYERVQYTTNGTTWIDYPASTSFNGIAGSGASGWETYPTEDYNDDLPYDNYPASLENYYDFSGFPGVANNPNFGVRIVLEYDDTATYGIDSMDNYLGVGPDTYAFNGDQGTETYDLVGFFGDAITNHNVPPVISAFYTNGIATTNEMTLDTVPITNTFTVSGDTTADQFTYSAQSLNPSTVNPNFYFTSNADGNCSLVIQPNPINPNVAAAPILVTVTDTNGDSTAAWFLLTVTTEYPSPTVTGLPETNTIANTSVGMPFTVSSPVDSVNQFSYTASSANNTVVPSGNVVVVTNGISTPTNPIVYVTPASNVLGVALISVTVNDNDVVEQKTTSATIPVEVFPNTNVIAIDYFNYDGSGALDTVAAEFWQHLSGHGGQMQVAASPAGGSVTVDTLNNTENLETPLVGAPYPTSASAKVTTLFYSFVVNMNPGNMPLENGTYFTALNDGQGITSDVEDLLVAATNGAAFGNYRLGIADDVGSTSAGAAMFTQDLVPGNNYVIVTALNLHTGQSTLWVNPTSQSSPSVTAAPDANTATYPIGDFELRESGGTAGAVNVSYVKVGTTFDSVFPSLHATPIGKNVIINWSDPTLGIQSATNLFGPFTDVSPGSPPYTNNASTNKFMFFRFGH